MKIFQILDGFCHWCTPFKSMDETANFPPDCIFVEAPDYVNEQWGFDETKTGDDRFIKPEVPEGWCYDEKTGCFYLEDELPNMLAAAQTRKQNENKMQFEYFLQSHPLTFIDGKKYGVTMEDQTEINLNISQYQLQCAARDAGADVTPVLEWHAIHEACVPWTLENLTALVVAISEFVYPWFKKMNEYKAAIYACKTHLEVEEISFYYRTEEEIAEAKAREEEMAAEEARWAEEEAARVAAEAEAAATEDAVEETPAEEVEAASEAAE